MGRLKAAWPECRISWLANTEWMPLLEGNPDVDRVIEFPRRELGGVTGMWRIPGWLQRSVRTLRPDVALDFQGLLRTALIARASGAVQVLGMSDAREGARWLYEKTVAVPLKPVHAVDRYLALADAALRTRGGTASEQTPQFSLPPGERPASFSAAVPYMVLHPFARGAGKSLDDEQLTVLLNGLCDLPVVLVGRGEYPRANQSPNCVDLLNRTSLSELIWLLRNAAFVLSVDSGPAHLAAALGRPLIALHAWSDPRKVGPYRDDAWVYMNHRLARVRDLPRMSASFFEPGPIELNATDIREICAFAATSISNSCA